MKQIISFEHVHVKPIDHDAYGINADVLHDFTAVMGLLYLMVSINRTFVILNFSVDWYIMTFGIYT